MGSGDSVGLPSGGIAGAERDGTEVVLAHALLTTMTTVTSSLSLLREDWDRLRPDDRKRLIDMAESQAQLVTELLTDMVRGMPDDIIAALSNLDERRAQRRAGREPG